VRGEGRKGSSNKRELITTTGEMKYRLGVERRFRVGKDDVHLNRRTKILGSRRGGKKNSQE